MELTYEQWHDGIGYDLEALAELRGTEQTAAEQLLVSRREQDWRDVEALERLNSPAALSALRANLESSVIVVRLRSAEFLADRGLIFNLDALVARSLPEAQIGYGLTDVIRLAEKHPTQKVREALFRCCLNGGKDIRVHSAALLFYLYGAARSAFDWDHRPFFLEFLSDDLAVRKRLIEELCLRIGVNVEEALGKTSPVV